MALARPLRFFQRMVPSRSTGRIIVVGHALLTGLLVAAVGCGSVSPANQDGGGGAGGSGGSGVAGMGGAAGRSPGSVTLRLVIPPSHSFCDQTTGCGGTSHISILNGAGHELGLSTPWCSTICSSTCRPSPCPGIACFPQGEAVKTSEFPWDGSSYGTSTCGNKMACYVPEVAPAGHYVARMCATPGNLTTADGGFPSTCTATGPVECVDVPFDFPGPSPIVGTLP
jgi:hypothetical protein